MKYFLSLLLAITFSITLNAQNYKQVKIYIQSLQDVEELQNAGLEFDHPNVTKDNAIIVLIDDDDFQKLQMTNFSYEVQIADWFDYYSKQPKLTESEKASFIQQSKDNYGVEGFGFGSMGGFYTLAEVISKIDSMRLLYPNLITTKVSIGNSVESRPIYMVKISDNADIDENEPELLYTALHHAREPQSMMQMIYFMYYLLENYNTNPSVQYIVNNREMYFIPVLNPDGYEYNRTTNPGGGGMWRKNRKNNGSSYGVDLNRNYGPTAYWNAPNGGSSTDPSSDTYRGTAPFSEPETTNLKNFLATRYFKNALNYHTYSNLLIYPYGALEQETPDSAIFREFARDMTAYNGYTYGTDQQTVGYSTRGNSDDYFYDGDTVSNHGKIFAMTPEVGSTGFWPSQPEIFPLAIENVLPNLYYAYVAGDYVSAINPYFSQQFFNPGDNVDLVIPQLKNKGLSDASNISLSLSSDNPLVTITSGSVNVGNISARTTVNNNQNLSFTIGSTMPADVNVKMLLTISTSGTPMFTDTLSFITGTPIMVFADTTNDPLLLWNITSTPVLPKWEATNLSFHSSPTSFTDSKTGNYSSNATVTMSLKNAIDLSANEHPRLSFWTKFDIESGWDYGQVEVSTNNGASFVPLTGSYTTLGSGSFQPNGEPLYDGIQTSWVNEIMDLTNYNTSQVKLKFELKTDGSLVQDGWFVDDISVVVYGIVPVELSSFNAIAQEDNVMLSWITSTETNNMGFDIERREIKSNSSWQKLGFVNGNGTTTEKSSYSYIDKNPFDGKSYYRLKQIDFDGSSKIYNAVEVDFETVKEYSLSQNYPNPFNPSTEIIYTLAKSGNITLKVYNLLGSEVATLVNGFMESGKHSAKFNAKDFTSGVYFYTIKADHFTSTRKMMLMK
ncbi:MAG: T9SS C-terminal target domain-containing protein [Ignavibacteriales bacterium]|nr:MAG: T9SS C-terminal target domain-containing protein [Ignavibacteriales bacterium]